MKGALIIGLIIIRLITNDGVFLNARRPQPKRTPTEVVRFIRRPAKKGKKKFMSPR